MAFGLDDVALSSIEQNTNEAVNEFGEELGFNSDIIYAESHSNQSSFRSTDFDIEDSSIERSLDSDGFDNLENTSEFEKLENAFSAQNFEESKDGFNSDRTTLPLGNDENDESLHIDPSIEEVSGRNSIEICSSDLQKRFNISFGNLYDDNTITFLNECKRYNVDLPTSVTHAGYGIDRSVNGGLLSIDKSIIETSLKAAMDEGKISKDIYKDLHNKLMAC